MWTNWHFVQVAKKKFSWGAARVSAQSPQLSEKVKNILASSVPLPKRSPRGIPPKNAWRNKREKQAAKEEIEEAAKQQNR